MKRRAFIGSAVLVALAAGVAGAMTYLNTPAPSAADGCCGSCADGCACCTGGECACDACECTCAGENCNGCSDCCGESCAEQAAPAAAQPKPCCAG